MVIIPHKTAQSSVIWRTATGVSPVATLPSVLALALALALALTATAADADAELPLLPSVRDTSALASCAFSSKTPVRDACFPRIHDRHARELDIPPAILPLMIETSRSASSFAPTWL